MTRHKVADLTGALLDMAVAMIEGERAKVLHERITMHHEDGTLDRVLVDEDRCLRLYESFDGTEKGGFWLHYSGKWELGGPIIARELISVYFHTESHLWVAGRNLDDVQTVSFDDEGATLMVDVDDSARVDDRAEGPTALIAAMRSHVIAKLGEEVDLP